MGAGTEKRQFGFGYGHQIKSYQIKSFKLNQIIYFLMTKQIGCSKLLQILVLLYL